MTNTTVQAGGSGQVKTLWEMVVPVVKLQPPAATIVALQAAAVVVVIPPKAQPAVVQKTTVAQPQTSAEIEPVVKKLKGGKLSISESVY
uniref:Uncharacterized protein n=1 Tax=Romanomermis culicivorax TaxID=13658 RepID=A0A915J0C4_ROMCU